MKVCIVDAILRFPNDPHDACQIQSARVAWFGYSADSMYYGWMEDQHDERMQMTDRQTLTSMGQGAQTCSGRPFRTSGMQLCTVYSGHF